MSRRRILSQNSDRKELPAGAGARLFGDGTAGQHQLRNYSSHSLTHNSRQPRSISGCLLQFVTPPARTTRSYLQLKPFTFQEGRPIIVAWRFQDDRNCGKTHALMDHDLREPARIAIGKGILTESSRTATQLTCRCPNETAGCSSAPGVFLHVRERW
jgi:hypothetical protein